jgi:hypothetical protein
MHAAARSCRQARAMLALLYNPHLCAADGGKELAERLLQHEVRDLGGQVTHEQ